MIPRVASETFFSFTAQTQQVCVAVEKWMDMEHESAEKSLQTTWFHVFHFQMSVYVKYLWQSPFYSAFVTVKVQMYPYICVAIARKEQLFLSL